MKLYPQLVRNPTLEQLALNLSRSSIDNCRQHRSHIHEYMEFSATGGHPASQHDVEQLAGALTSIAEKYGYPNECRDSRKLDIEWAESLHQIMAITPHEASKEGIWHFLTCIVVPDLVIWRWGTRSDEIVSDRWITVRHRGRNCFGRLWWRAEILQNDEVGSRYQLLHDLKEDEFVQIMERPWLAGNRMLSKVTVTLLIATAKKNQLNDRSDLFREVQKKLLRYGAFLEFEAMNSRDIEKLVLQVFEDSLESLKNGK